MTTTAELTLPTDTQILIRREFDAPRHLVWRAWTEPDLVRRWWGGRRGTITVLERDFRVGGQWRTVLVAGGFEAAFHGEFREIEPGAQIVQTETFEGAPDAEAVETITFADGPAADRTTVTMLIQHASQQNRDGHVASGMEDGLNEALVDLEAVARSLA